MTCWQCGGTGKDGSEPDSDPCCTCSGIGKVFLRGDGIIPVDCRTQREIVRQGDYIGAPFSKKGVMHEYEVHFVTDPIGPSGPWIYRIRFPIPPQIGQTIRVRELEGRKPLVGVVADIIISSDDQGVTVFVKEQK